MFSKKILVGAFLSLISLSTFAAQPKDEVQVTGETDLVVTQDKKEYPIGQGCEIRPKDGCQERYLCHAVVPIFGKSPASVNAAVKKANILARGELSKTIGGMDTSTEDNCKDKHAVYQKDGLSTEQIGSLCESVVKSGSKAFLEGVELLATKIDMEDSEVTVQIGQKCSGVAAAQSSRRKSPSSNSNGSSNSPDQPQQNPTSPAPGNSKSKSQMRDDF
jgi:hypothetical protein